MKRSIRSITAVIVSTLLFYSPANAQWVTNGPYGGFVGSLLKDGGTIYAGAGNRIYKSVNDGSSWAKAGNKSLYGVTDLVLSNGKIFAASSGVFVSADGAVTWTQKNNGLSGSVNVLLANQTGVFAAADDDLFFTSNGGDSWTEIGAGLDGINNHIQALMQYGDTLFAGIGGEHGRLFMSTDNGVNFIPVSGFPTMHAVYTLAHEGDNIYAGTWFGVFKSADRGATWASSGSGMSGGYTMSMITAHGKIFASTLEGGMFVSTNDAASWTKANTGIMGWFAPDKAPYPYAVAMVETVAGLVAATNDGIYVSADAGSSWTMSNDEIEANMMQSIAAKGDHVYGGAGRMYASSNKGTSWTLAQNGIEGSNILAITVQGSGVLASTANQKLYRSTDNGTSWTKAGTGISGRVDVLASNEQRVVAIVRQVGTANQKLMQSLDGGLNFTDMPAATGIGGMMRATALYEERIYVGNDKGMLFRSDDDGETWRDIGYYLPTVAITEIIALGDQTYASTSGKGVFRFTENDYKMETFSAGLPNYDITDLAREDNLIFASTGGAGIFATQLGKESWFNVTGDLANIFVSRMASANGKVYAATGTGVYQLSDEAYEQYRLLAGVGEKAAGMVSTFPNPASNALFYQVGETSSSDYYQVRLIDVNGGVVRSIPDAPARGSIDLKGLSDGFYILEMRTAQGIKARKILVEN
jgi:hypothetical protein